MVVQSRSNRTPAQRLAAGGSVAIGALWTCIPRGAVSSTFALGSAAPHRVPSQQLRHGRIAGTKAAEAGPTASFSESLPTLGVSGALAAVSAAGLRASKRHQPNQRVVAVQRGPWRKKLAEFFGLGKGSSGTLRDGWQELADQAASVASKAAKAKAPPKKAAPAAKAEPAAASSASAVTLRDCWQAQAERAVFVAANGPGKASSLPVAAATSAQKAFDVFKPETYGNITMDDVKKYGTAGTVAYVVTELIFWAVAIPAECAVFYETAGRWPDFSNDYDKAAVLGFVFAASNIARLCLPLRFGAALAMAPWVDENLINPGKKAAQEGSS